MSRLYIALCTVLMCHAVVAHELFDDVQSMMHHVVDVGIRENCISDAEQEIYRKFAQDGVVDRNEWKQLYKIIARIMKHADHGISKQECKQLLKHVKDACVCQTRQSYGVPASQCTRQLRSNNLMTSTASSKRSQSFTGPFAVAFGNQSAGFNFAAGDDPISVSPQGGVATSNNSYGFNFAARDGQATSSGESDGFNFAGPATTCSSADTAHSMNFATGFGRDANEFPHRPAEIATTGYGANNNDLFCFNVAVGENTSITVNRKNGNNNVAEAVIIATNGATVDTTVAGNNYGDGVNIDVGSGSGGGELRLFNLNTTGTGNPLEIGANGVVHDTSSTRHHKADIRSLDRNVLDKLMQLRSVQFARRGGEDSHEYGLIAEEVAHILRDIVVYDADGTPHGICYRQLTPLLLTAIQQQQQALYEQEEQLAQQQQENQELRDMVHELREQDAQRQQEIEYLYQMVGA